MTEEQKRLREHFLEPETRCGHFIGVDTKACWKAMLDMLAEVDRICRKHDIKYFLIAGSLLGAIRHKGFIPWDDDVDVALFREDYDKLEKILPAELPANMFMQTSATDPGYDTPHMKIRLAGTAAIQEWAIKNRCRYHMGIFIDLFALDGIPKTKTGQRMAFMIGCRLKELVSYYSMRRKLTKKREWVKKTFYSFARRVVGLKSIYRLREWIFARFRVCPDGECVQNPCAWGYDQRYRYAVADFSTAVDVPFEYLTLMVPANYEKVLTDTYGDWHKIVKGDSAHHVVDMSATTDYKAILREKYGFSEAELKKCPPSVH